MADDKGQGVRPEDQVPKMRSSREVGDMIRRGNSFDADLYRLMTKADRKNFVKLRRAFPEQAREFVNWFHGGKF